MPESISLPGFKSNQSWSNRWYLSNHELAEISSTDAGLMRLEKAGKNPVHLILNGHSEDLKQLRGDGGVSIGADEAYSVRFRAIKSGQMKLQVILHEFDAAGERVARLVVENRREYLYVPSKQADFLIVSIRASGAGYGVVQELELVASRNSGSQSSGLHSVEAAKAAGSQNAIGRAEFDDLKKFMVKNRTFHQKIAASTKTYLQEDFAVPTDRLTKILDRMDAISDQVGLVAQRLEQIETRILRMHLDEELSSVPGISIENTNYSDNERINP